MSPLGRMAALLPGLRRRRPSGSVRPAAHDGPVGPATVNEVTEWTGALLARRAVTRRGLLVGAGAAAAAVAAYPLARAVFGAGGGTVGRLGLVLSGRHLSWVSDGGADPSSGVRITAQLLGPDGRVPAGLTAVADLGDAPGAYGRPVPARIVHLVGGGGSQFYVKAALVGLRPATTYDYRLRLSDGTVTGDAHFTTAPARRTGGAGGPVPAPFTFTAFADVGTNAPPPHGTLRNGYAADDPVAGTGGTDPHPAATQTGLMATQRPAFTLLAGDICYADAGGTGLPADDFDPYVWDVFLAQIDRQAAYVPWLFATGYRDMEPLHGGSHGYAGHAARLDLPRNGPSGCPSVYSFVYANVGVVSLDANDLSHEIRTNTGYSGGAQVRWLEETLRAWRRDPAMTSWSRSSTTAPTRRPRSTPPTAGCGGARRAVHPLAGDLAVQGHNHVMDGPTRSAPAGRPGPPRTGPRWSRRPTGSPTSASARAAGPATRSRPGPPSDTGHTPPAPARRLVRLGRGRDQAAETVAWSRGRSTARLPRRRRRPARPDRPTTSRCDAGRRAARPAQSGTEIDQVTLRRVAGSFPDLLKNFPRAVEVGAARSSSVEKAGCAARSGGDLPMTTTAAPTTTRAAARPPPSPARCSARAPWPGRSTSPSLARPGIDPEQLRPEPRARPSSLLESGSLGWIKAPPSSAPAQWFAAFPHRPGPRRCPSVGTAAALHPVRRRAGHGPHVHRRPDDGLPVRTPAGPTRGPG